MFLLSFQAGYLRNRWHRIQRVCAGRKLNPALFLFRCFLCVWEWNCLCVIAAVFVVLGNYANAIFLRFLIGFKNLFKNLFLD